MDNVSWVQVSWKAVVGAKCRGRLSWGAYMSWKAVVGSTDVLVYYERQVSWMHVVDDIVGNKGVVDDIVGNKGVVDDIVGCMGTNPVPGVVDACRGRRRGCMGTNLVSWETSWGAWVQISVPGVVDACRGRHRGCMGTSWFQVSWMPVVEGIVGNMVTNMKVVGQRCRGYMSWMTSWIHGRKCE